MNIVKVKDKKVLYIEDHDTLEFYFYQEDAISYEFHLGTKSTLKVYHYNEDASLDVSIYLDGEFSEVEYHMSILNLGQNEVKVQVVHQASHTISNLYHHGVNVNDNSLHFDICSQVPKTSLQCVCNQENQIINLRNGKSTILPKLLIDQYDVSSSHSAYIGKFSDEVLFYLLSRGISKEKAEGMLMEALLVNQGNPEKEEVKRMISKVFSL